MLDAPDRQVDAWLNHARLLGHLVLELISEISIMANRTVRVGIDDAPPAPMQLGNPDAGDFRGYEVDLLENDGTQQRLLLRWFGDGQARGVDDSPNLAR